jgi:hypothetical protein
VLPEGANTVRDADSAEPVISVRGSAAGLAARALPRRGGAERSTQGRRRGGEPRCVRACRRVTAGHERESRRACCWLGATQGTSALDVASPPRPRVARRGDHAASVNQRDPRQVTVEREGSLSQSKGRL